MDRRKYMYLTVLSFWETLPCDYNKLTDYVLIPIGGL